MRRSKWGGNNPILALKLHILLCILMKSIRMSFKPKLFILIWQDDQNEGYNPILALKLHILLCILKKSICMPFKPL